MSVRSYQGHAFVLPDPRMKGVFAAATRWRLISEGIAEVIVHCPVEERALVANLQYAWMQAESERERLQNPDLQGRFECVM